MVGLVIGFAGLGAYTERAFRIYAEPYVARVELSNEGARRSNELTRQYTSRAVDEIRANTEIERLTHERNLILFREVVKFRHELKDIINQRSA
jgi:hypothetical protein